jgi:hypothetical protein
MPRIKQYFADEKITPNDLGTSAWETAGRRIGPLYDQIGQNDEKLAKDIANLWTEDLKFGLDQLDRTDRGGGFKTQGAGSLGRDLIGTGNNAGNRGAQTINQSVYAGPNLKTQNEVSGGAANLGDMVTKLSLGQGLTDQQWAVLNASKQAKDAPGYQGAGGTLATGKEAIAPNPEVSDQDAAKAGFNVDGYGYTGAKGGYGQIVPSYPAGTTADWTPPNSSLTPDEKGNLAQLPEGMQKTGEFGLDTGNVTPADQPGGQPAESTGENIPVVGTTDTGQQTTIPTPQDQAPPPQPTDGYSVWGAISGAVSGVFSQQQGEAGGDTE